MVEMNHPGINLSGTEGRQSYPGVGVPASAGGLSVTRSGRPDAYVTRYVHGTRRSHQTLEGVFPQKRWKSRPNHETCRGAGAFTGACTVGSRRQAWARPAGQT